MSAAEDFERFDEWDDDGWSLDEIHQDLEAHMSGDAPDGPPQDDERAEELLTWLRRAMTAKEHVVALANARRSKLRAWEQGRLAKIDGRIDQLQADLASYHQAVLRERPKARVIDLPTGRLRIRAQQPTWEFSSEFIDWCKVADREDLLRVKYEIEANDAKKALTTPDLKELDPGVTISPEYAGETVPGVAVTTRPDKHWIES